VLTTFQLHIDGRRHTLLPATSIQARSGEVLLIQADGQERRTALALALTGRMKANTGTVALEQENTLAGLRRRSAIIDSPDVNEAENYMTVKSLTSEDLALVPSKFRDRTRPTAWLVKHGFRDILDQWVEEVPADRLLHLLLALAMADRDVDVVVADSPDRHTADPLGWLDLLGRTADGTLDAYSELDGEPRTRIVIAVVARIPDEWDGPTAYAGNAIMLPETGSATAQPVTGSATAQPVTDDEVEDDEVATAATETSPPDPAVESEPEPESPEPSPGATEDDGMSQPSDVVPVEEAPAEPHKDLS